MAPHADEKTTRSPRQDGRSKSHRNKGRKNTLYNDDSYRFSGKWLVGVTALSVLASVYFAPMIDIGLRHAARSFLELKNDPFLEPRRDPILKTNEAQKPVVPENPADNTGYVCKHGYSIKILNQDPLLVYLKDFLQEGEAEHIQMLA
jgi:hypothetical protein